MAREPEKPKAQTSPAPARAAHIPTTGLPTDVKPTDDIARLQRSREWLKIYLEARRRA